MMETNSKILVTGHKGLVGSAMVRELIKQGYQNVITIERNNDLTVQTDVWYLFRTLKPDYVINCAGLVGGIHANDTRSGEFIYDNLMIQANVIEASRVHNVKKLLYLGSSCIYPKLAPQPIKEESLMTSALEETNMGYAIAKIAGLVMCDMYRKQYGSNFIAVMPTNLYGINDNFNLKKAHVLPAIIRKIHEAKDSNCPSVEFWGTGSPMREFMFVDDMANACVFLMNKWDDGGYINIGTGEDMSIKETIDIISQIIGYSGSITWNADYPDGTPKKQLDVSRLHAMGWKHTTSFKDGVVQTYKWFVDNYANIRE